MLPPAWVRITRLRAAWRPLSAAGLPVPSLGWAGPLGKRHAWRTAPAGHGDLVAQRRTDAALSWPYDGPQAGPGARRAARWLPPRCRRRAAQSPPWQGLATRVWIRRNGGPRRARNRAMASSWCRPSGGRRLKPLADASLVAADGGRCHIAWNCRAAKQDWGLQDVLQVTPTGGTKAAPLSWFMGHVAYRLQADRRQPAPDSRILDWPAACRGSPYVEERRQMLPEKPEPLLWRQMRTKVACCGRRHAVQPSFSLS